MIIDGKWKQFHQKYGEMWEDLGMARAMGRKVIDTLGGYGKFKQALMDLVEEGMGGGLKFESDKSILGKILSKTIGMKIEAGMDLKTVKKALEEVDANTLALAVQDTIKDIYFDTSTSDLQKSSEFVRFAHDMYERMHVHGTKTTLGQMVSSADNPVKEITDRKRDERIAKEYREEKKLKELGNTFNGM
jgi:hypothetical protein